MNPPINRRRAAFFNMAFGSSNAIVSAVVGLLMVPVYLKFMDIATYGAWLACTGILSMVSMLESGIGTVATQMLAAAHSKGDKERFSVLAGSAVALTAMLAIVVCVLGSILSIWLPGLVHAPEIVHQELSRAVVIASIGSGCTIMFLTVGAIPQALQQTLAPGFIGLVAQLIGVTAILAGLYGRLGVVALSLGPLSQALTYLLGYAFFIFPIWKGFRIPKMRATLKEMGELWRDSRVLLMSRIASAVGTGLEAPAAAIGISAEASAVLVITGRVVAVAQMFMERITTAVFAGVAHMSGTDKAHRKTVIIEIVTVSAVMSGIAVGGSIALSASAISLWVGKSLFGGLPLLLLIAISAILSSRKSLICSLLIALGYTRQSAPWLILDPILRVILVAVCMWQLDIVGIPIAAIATSLIVIIGFSRQYAVHIDDLSVLIKPGLKGFLVPVLFGTAWAALVQVAVSWHQFVLQAFFLAIFVLLGSLLDREWRVALKNSVTMLLKRQAVLS